MRISRRNLQKWLRPLERTPLHPQFLVLQHRTEIGSWISTYAHGTLADIGCGDGALRHQLPGSVRYVGIDYPGTVALGYEGSPDILADAACLPIATSSIDVVTLLDVLEHLRNPDKALSEIARILRPEGRCLIHVPFIYPLHDEPHDYQRWTRYGLQQLATRNGLLVIDIAESLPSVTTAAALAAMALASAVLEGAHRPGRGFLLAALLLPLIPVVNIAGWAAGKLLPAAAIMPFSYRLVATPNAAAPLRSHPAPALCGESTFSNAHVPDLRRENEGRCTWKGPDVTS